MKNSKFIMKLAAILFAIAFICTFILVLCDNITAPIIDQNIKLAEEEAKENILPEANGGFEEKKSFESDGVTNAYIGKNKNGEIVGYCFKISTKNNRNKAFGGEIQMMVGVDTNLNITGIDLTNMSETPGLGAKADEDEFKNQFKGKNSELSVVKTGNAKDDEINTISGATLTSKAVTEGVNNAIKAAKLLKETEAK